MEEHDISTCVFEWTVYYGSSIQNMFFGAAKNLKIPTISIPHGVSIYATYDVMELDREFYRKTGKIRQVTQMGDMDLFINPNMPTQELHVCAGISSAISEVWGSARYYPEWATINLEMCPGFTASKPAEGMVKVVLMLPHWAYNVDVPETISLINQLANLPWVYTVIKDHTRGGGGLDNKFRKKLDSLPNVEASVSAHSPALIGWSDVVINFGSSIGIEAVLQDKILINPSYLHTNQTIFEKTSAAFEPSNTEELIEILNKNRNNDLEPVSAENKMRLLEEGVYGGKGAYDILEYYYENISNIRNRANYKFAPVPNHVTKVYRTLVHRITYKLQVPYMLVRDNPIKSLKRVIKWISRTYFNIYIWGDDKDKYA